MARPEARLDLLHVPTPLSLCRQIGTFLDVPTNVVALDPCCGNGDALEALTSGRGSRYGIELDLRRSREAGQRLTRAICCDTFEARISHQAFGLILLNPPYDDSTMGRLEDAFLERAVNWLRPGGVLVFIVKQAHYRSELSRLISRHFEDIRHWRFPAPFFDGPDLAFHQTVLIARRKLHSSLAPEVMTKLMEDRTRDLEPFMPPEGETYRVPAGVQPQTFVAGCLTPEALEEIVQGSTLRRIPATRGDMTGRPPLPLKKGHQALVLASGLIDGVYGEGPTLHVSKGTVRRSETAESSVEYDDDSRPTVTVKTTMGFEIIVRALTTDGRIHDIAGKKKEAAEAQIATGEADAS